MQCAPTKASAVRIDSASQAVKRKGINPEGMMQIQGWGYETCFPYLLTLTMRFQGSAKSELQNAIAERHAVRHYLSTPISDGTVSCINKAVRQINVKSGLNIQLVVDDPQALSDLFVTYGRFSGARNYFALVGPSGENLLENIGYYGELIALTCQSLGLNTCWVGGTYRKNPHRVVVNEGEEFVAIIAVGYGKNQGKQHTGKPIEELADGLENAPRWYVEGVRSAMLGPSAHNKQNFRFNYQNGKVSVSGIAGKYSQIDVGIAKLHFEIGSGRSSEIWQETE